MGHGRFTFVCHDQNLPLVSSSPSSKTARETCREASESVRILVSLRLRYFPLGEARERRRCREAAGDLSGWAARFSQRAWQEIIARAGHAISLVPPYTPSCLCSIDVQASRSSCVAATRAEEARAVPCERFRQSSTPLADATFTRAPSGEGCNIPPTLLLLFTLYFLIPSSNFRSSVCQRPPCRLVR